MICITVLSALVQAAPQAGAIEHVFEHYGTGTLMHPLEEPGEVRYPPCYDAGPCQCLPQHVHMFAVNGLNPMCLGNFNGMCDYLRKHGFKNIYFGQLYSSHWFCNKVREIRKKDPLARIAIVGYSLGANYVRYMVNNLAKDGTRVDLLVYLGGDHVHNDAGSRPPNVARVVNVRSHGIVLTGGDLFFNGEDLDGARNVMLDTRHIMIPSRAQALELMLEEMLMLACYRSDEAPIEPVPQIELPLPVPMSAQQRQYPAATAQHSTAQRPTARPVQRSPLPTTKVGR